MTLKEALYTYLSTYAGLVALIGTRIYPQMLPEGVALPAINFFTVSQPYEYTHDGHDGAIETRMQFSCWAKTSKAVESVAAQLVAALSGYTGLMGGVGGVNIGHSFKSNEVDLPEPDAGIYHKALDFLIGTF